MKNLVKYTLIILFLYTFEADIYITNLKESECDENRGLTTFEIVAYSTEPLYEYIEFQLEIGEFNAFCSIPPNYPISPNGTSTDEPTTAIPTNVPTNTSTPTNVPTNTATPTNIPTSTAIPTNIPTNITIPTTFPKNTTIKTTFPKNKTIKTTFPKNTTIKTTFPTNTTTPTTFPKNIDIKTTFPTNITTLTTFLTNKTTPTTFPKNTTIKTTFPTNTTTPTTFPKNTTIKTTFPTNRTTLTTFLTNTTTPTTFPTNTTIKTTFPMELTIPFETDEISEGSDEFSGQISFRHRVLSESINLEGGKCQISENIKNKVDGQKVNSNSTKVFVNNLKYSLNICSEKEGSYEATLSISFRQLNKFIYYVEQKLVNFYFYGMLTDNFQKGYQITMDVYLIKNGFQEDKSTTAICILTNNVEKKEKPVQGNFKCSILNVEGSVTSFTYHSSKSIAGVPSDKILLDPELTKKYISKGDLYDYSVIGNSTIETPSFHIISIDSLKCEETGRFIAKGELSLELEYDIQFELPFANPINLTANCNISRTKDKSNVYMECKTKGIISNQPIKIAQITLLNDRKKELLIIEKYESQKEHTCANSRIKIVDYPITFRQVNKFRKFDNRKFSFFFAGLSPKRINQGETITILVVFIKDDLKKNQKEIECKLISDVIPFNGGYAQADFNCEGELELGEDADSIEIISSNNVTGINDKLEDYQKNPKLTEEEIERTKNNEGIGKVLDYSLQANKLDIVPIIQIISISNINKCSDKGKIQFKAKFNDDMNQRLDFEIPLSYPSSSIKCSSPKAKANKEIFIDCKVQKDFYRIDEIFIEPTIIKKKNKEILFASKFYLNKIGNINCADYNARQILLAQQKYDSNFTFVQTNSFNIIQKRILFHLILYSLTKEYKKTIKVFVTLTKKISTLRNLEEIYETDVKCTNEQSSQLGNYICNIDNTDIKTKDEIESFFIESDDIPGFSETNTNPIEIDESILRGRAINFSDPEIMKLSFPTLDVTYLNDTLCEKEGFFTMNGKLNKEVNEEGRNAELTYINPSDSGAICNFNKSNNNGKMDITCHNKDYFEDETLIIGPQMIGGKFILKKIPCDGSNTTTCLISSNSNSDSEPQLEESIKNNYFNTKSSSSGLSGAAISAIVIVCFAMLVLIGVIIALIRTKIIPSMNQTNYNTSVIPVSTSSVDII